MRRLLISASAAIVMICGLATTAQAAVPSGQTSAAVPASQSTSTGLYLPGDGIYLSNARPDSVFTAPIGAAGLTNGAMATPMASGGSRHSETVTCASTGFYRNYDPGTDHFSTQDGTYYQGNVISVRDAPYRTYGPRGVVVYMQAEWGFMSNNCLSG